LTRNEGQRPINLVEIIGRQWDWYGLTLRYRDEFDNPNAVQSYKTEDGLLLGRWQGTQKGNYKRGVLTPERIRCLEEIGFKWGKQR
jgi:hypothetical protein